MDMGIRLSFTNGIKIKMIWLIWQIRGSELILPIVLLTVITIDTAVAADIRFIEIMNELGRCEMSGEIVAGDEVKFKEIVTLNECILTLDSPGGNYNTALKIVKIMDEFSTPTIVENGNQCLSACALIFMAGTMSEEGAYAHRTIDEGGTVGFHRPYLDLRNSKSGAFTSKQVEDAFSASVDVINNLIKRSTKRYDPTDPSSESLYFPTLLLTKMLEKGREDFYKIETVGDLLIAGVYYKELFDGDIADRVPVAKAFRNVCENFYWQEIENFQLDDQKKDKFDVVTFFDVDYEKYVRSPAQTEENIGGQRYTVFHDYPAPEGTYRDCLVNKNDRTFTATFRDDGDSYKFTNLRGIFALPRHMSITGGILEAIEPSIDKIFDTRNQPTSFTQLNNIDLDGNELKRLRGIPQYSCETLCRSDPSCAGYTYDKWNQWCFLKNSIRVQFVSPKSVSGLKFGSRSPPSSANIVEMKRYRKKHFPGDGYATVRAPSPDTCEGECIDQIQCIAFTYFYEDNLCRLFSSVGEYFSHERADSGAKTQR